MMDEQQDDQLEVVEGLLREFENGVYWLRKRNEALDERRRNLLRDFLQRALDAFDELEMNE